MEKKRDLSMDLLRICSALFVVLLHTSALYMALKGGSPDSAEWQTANLFNSMTRWTVPVFIMISGAFLLQKEIPVRLLYGKYIKHIVVLLLIWNTCYNVPGIFTPPLLSFKNLITNILIHTDRGIHLWFLYMLAGVYAVSPFLKKIVDGALSKYFLCLWLLGSVLFLGFERSGIAPLETLSDITLQFTTYITIGYAGYFVLGYYLYRQQPLSQPVRRILYALGIAGMCAAAVGTSLLSLHKGEYSAYFHDNHNIATVLTATALFVYFHYRKFSFTPKAERFIKRCSDLTLGIYLVHVLILKILSYILFPLALPAAPVIILTWILTSALSLLFSFTVRKIPGIGFIVK